MDKFRQLIQTVLFCSFFTIGIVAITATALSQEAIEYYRNKNLLYQTKMQIVRLEEKYNKYTEQVEFAKSHPKAIERLRTVQFGDAPKSDDQVYYPKANSKIETNINELKNQDAFVTNTSNIPTWLERINQPKPKMMIFILGSLLVLIAFGLFGGITDNRELSNE